VDVAPAGAILVIEDDAGIRDTLAEYLREEGFTVEVARNGAEGLERIDASRPALVLLDLLMPVLGGAPLLARLRAHAAHRTLPVVLMTGDHGAAVPGAAAAAAAADAVLRKPFELEDLLDTVRRFVPSRP
jgi:DNA-binding response OmpR family regulator